MERIATMTPPGHARVNIAARKARFRSRTIEGLGTNETTEFVFALCKLTAIKLGFKHQIIDKMVHNTVEMIAKGIAVDIALARLLNLVE